MKNSRTRIYIIVAVFAIVGCFVFIMLSGKIQDTYNEYNVTYTYFDTERIYVSELDFFFDLETDATYKEEIKIQKDRQSLFFINGNNLTDDGTIRIRDKKSNVLCERTLSNKEKQQYISNDVYTEGSYIIEISLPAGCVGSLEIIVNEE